MNFSEKNYPGINSIQHLIDLTKAEIATQIATRQATLNASNGITIDGTTVKHTNNLSQARPSQPSLLKTTIDAQGHVTAFTDIGITNAVVENSNAAITSGGVYTALQNVSPNEMTPAQVQEIWNSVPGGGGGGGSSSVYTNHNSGFRGKNLGTTFTAEQKAAIADGSFNDLYVGDYWTFDETVWRIIDIDTFFNFGHPTTNAHHVVIMPDTSLTSSAWGSGYFTESTIATTVIPQLVSDFENTVGTYLINQAYKNMGSSTNWVQYKMMVPCLSNIFGHCELRESPISTNSHPFMQSQFALFRYMRNFIIQQDNVNVWTTDYNANLNANLVVDLNGYYGYNGLSTVNGIRPYALLAGVDQSQE